MIARLAAVLAALAVLASLALPPLARAGGAAVRRPIRPDAEAVVFPRAVEDYTRTCEACHQPDGYGLDGMVPRLRNFAGYFTHLPAGREFLIRVPGVSMALLDDQRITNVVNWILYSLSPNQLPPDFQPYTVEEVSRLRSRPLDQIVQTRAALIDELRAKGIVPDSDNGMGVRVMR